MLSMHEAHKDNNMQRILTKDGCYTGQVKNGLRHGIGHCVENDGVEYDGEWYNDQMHGYGKFTQAPGNYYKGQFLNNDYHGVGTLVTPEQKYVGQMKHGKMHGKGMLTYAYGGRFIGNFENGQLYGTFRVLSPGNVLSDDLHIFNHNDRSILLCSNGKECSLHFSLKDGEVYKALLCCGNTFFALERKQTINRDGSQVECLLTREGNTAVELHNDTVLYMGSYAHNLRHGTGMIKQANGEYISAEFEEDLLVALIVD